MLKVYEYFLLNEKFSFFSYKIFLVINRWINENFFKYKFFIIIFNYSIFFLNSLEDV